MGLAVNIVVMPTVEQTTVEPGMLLRCVGAGGEERTARAISGVTAGGDFAVVWACSEREWDDAVEHDREPDGIPWPIEDVRRA